MTAILNVAYGGNLVAGTYLSAVYQVRAQSGQAPMPAAFSAQKTFATATGGTTTDTYLQTSFDGGTTWCDVVHFPQNVTAATQVTAGVAAANAAATAPLAVTDGTQTVNTINQGVFGSLWRVKYITTGTYTSGNLRVDICGMGLVPYGAGTS
jgi:hypothetical protein